MKLTNSMRENIQNKIKKELLSPEEIKRIESEIGMELRKIIEPTIEKGWEKFRRHMIISSNLYLRYAPTETDGYYPCPDYPDRGVQDTFNFKDLPKELQKKIQDYSDKILEVNKKISEVNKILLSCNTVKQLFDIVPEFEKYIDIEKSSYLPVPVEVIQDVKNTLNSVKGE